MKANMQKLLRTLDLTGHTYLFTEEILVWPQVPVAVLTVQYVFNMEGDLWHSIADWNQYTFNAPAC